MNDEILRLQLEAERPLREAHERAHLIVRMLASGNDAARAQAVAAVERGCVAELALASIRDLPNQHDLLTNAVARAMYEITKKVI